MVRVASALLAVGAIPLMGSSTASACPPSGWLLTTTPHQLACLSVKELGEEEKLELYNACDDPVELTPELCEEPCSETVHVAAKATATLVLPTAAVESEEPQVFDYRMADQTGTITLEFDLTECPSGTGCAAVSLKGRASVPWVATGLVSLMLFVFARRIRANR